MPNQRHHHKVVGKSVCRQCKAFMGLITDDGKGPYIDSCPSREMSCPMIDELSRFRPAATPLKLADDWSRGDPDLGGLPAQSDFREERKRFNTFINDL